VSEDIGIFKSPAEVFALEAVITAEFFIFDPFLLVRTPVNLLKRRRLSMIFAENAKTWQILPVDPLF
jgi:hypothetical protein